MLKKFLDKIKPTIDPLLTKGKVQLKQVEVKAREQWAKPKMKSGAYLVATLLIGVFFGQMLAPNKGNELKSQKIVAVDKAGIINISLPGVILAPEVFEFAQSLESNVPVSLSVPGKLAFNAERLKVISARAPGRVERIYAFDGAFVKQGQAVADFYSPDYVSAQTEYILSARMLSTLQKAQIGSLYEDAQFTLEAAANRLRVLGASNEDIVRLKNGGEATPTFPIRTPIDGVVIKRAVDPGAFLNTGDILATVADPKNLWFLGNVYEQDVGKIKVGDVFHLKVESFPGRDFIAKANYVGATIDPVTHALVVRCEVDNSDGLLKPEMFVSGKLEISKTPAITLPSTAIIQARNLRFVIIKTGPDSYRRLPINGFDLNAQEFAVTDGLTVGQNVLIKGATLLNQRFLREED
ncbi:membrane fusion protein, Cu(I)/Ag(I) efflux system [Polynucleobacter meluiroseus]|uniref:Membrane fusion protein, Cu(I)/Ag(I) efflux system n=1 Tax=Polynucleobacter meluiroseus TaxID=1938814 RepID=A0A240E4P1_9BURK|nr:efflux RND transporter periplasmic adaptor subunit [Polynucleobacter meluiroseus]SNX29501.1 membrane fusion protein, Cu(I)/Ag(I) efflux system [Polynucleobacter meluiroseus]